MRLLIDMCVPVSLVRELEIGGHNVVHMREIDPRAADKRIVERARTEKRVVVTMDLDFGDIMSHIDDKEPSVVLFRLRHPTPGNIRSKLDYAFLSFKEQIEQGAIIIVEETRYRVRRLPIAHQ